LDNMKQKTKLHLQIVWNFIKVIITIIGAISVIQYMITDILKHFK
jgi:hypothetical protein